MTAFKNGISWFLVTSMVFGLILGAGCAGEETPVVGEGAQEQDHSHDHGPHDGPVVVIGDHLAHMEAIHHCGDGTLTLYLLDENMSAPVEADGPIQINLKTTEGPKQITMKGVDGGLSVFEVTDPALASHELDGQIVVSLGGSQYFLPMPAHEHAPAAEEDDHGSEGEAEEEHSHEGEEGDAHDEG